MTSTTKQMRPNGRGAVGWESRRYMSCKRSCSNNRESFKSMGDTNLPMFTRVNIGHLNKSCDVYFSFLMMLSDALWALQPELRTNNEQVSELITTFSFWTPAYCSGGCSSLYLVPDRSSTLHAPHAQGRGSILTCLRVALKLNCNSIRILIYRLVMGLLPVWVYLGLLARDFGIPDVLLVRAEHRCTRREWAWYLQKDRKGPIMHGITRP